MSTLALISSALWLAYSTPGVYGAPTWEGGGGGRYFTGTVVDGLSCDVCHGGGDPLALELAGLPEGGWEPGATYTIDISWSPMVEHAGVLAEIADASGAAIGELSLPPDELLTNAERCGSGTRAASAIEPAEGRRLLAIGDCGAHRLRFQWRAPEQAPEADVGPWLHLASVHGDGSGDVRGDGPGLQVIPLATSDAAAASGCRLSGGGEERAPLGLAVLTLLGALARKRRSGGGEERALLGGPAQGRRSDGEERALLGLLARRRRSSVVLGIALLPGLLGCVRVQPWERERLAQPDMQMSLDADLSAGAEHAVEYREGSAGAFGGAGGGCGCN